MLEPEITAEVFALQRQGPDAPLLLDVREPWEAAFASLPNSVLMPMGDVPSRAHQELDPDQKIVVLCHHGADAAPGGRFPSTEAVALFRLNALDAGVKGAVEQSLSQPRR